MGEKEDGRRKMGEEEEERPYKGEGEGEEEEMIFGY